MWQKVKKFILSNDIEEQHKKNMRQIEMQFEKAMQELIGLAEDINQTEQLILSELKSIKKDEDK